MRYYRYEDRLWIKRATPKKLYYLREFEIESRTPKGYWIVEIKDGKRLKKKWLSRRKRCNYFEKTQSEALMSYYRRKNYHIGYLRNTIWRIERILRDLNRDVGDLCNIKDIEDFLNRGEFLERDEMDI